MRNLLEDSSVAQSLDVRARLTGSLRIPRMKFSRSGFRTPSSLACADRRLGGAPQLVQCPLLVVHRPLVAPNMLRDRLFGIDQDVRGDIVLMDLGLGIFDRLSI